MRDSLGHRWRAGVWWEWCAPEWIAAQPEDWRETLFETEQGDRFHAKQGRSIARWTLSQSEPRLRVYLKRHYRGSWGQRAWAMLRGRVGHSAAWQEFEHLRWARKQGFAVPRPIAVGEQNGPAGTFRSFLAIEELAGMAPLHELIPLAAERLSAPAFHRWKGGLTHALAHLVARLHAHAHFHKDLYLCHFYLPEALACYIPAGWSDLHMIDLHRLGHHPWTSAWWRLKDLAQLLYSSEVAGVTARDRARFWRVYAQGSRLALGTRMLRRGILLRCRNYQRHNAASVPRRHAA